MSIDSIKNKVATAIAVKYAAVGVGSRISREIVEIESNFRCVRSEYRKIVDRGIFSEPECRLVVEEGGQTQADIAQLKSRLDDEAKGLGKFGSFIDGVKGVCRMGYGYEIKNLKKMDGKISEMRSNNLFAGRNNEMENPMAEHDDIVAMTAEVVGLPKEIGGRGSEGESSCTEVILGFWSASTTSEDFGAQVRNYLKNKKFIDIDFCKFTQSSVVKIIGEIIGLPGDNERRLKISGLAICNSVAGDLVLRHLKQIAPIISDLRVIADWGRKDEKTAAFFDALSAMTNLKTFDIKVNYGCRLAFPRLVGFDEGSSVHNLGCVNIEFESIDMSSGKGIFYIMDFFRGVKLFTVDARMQKFGVEYFEREIGRELRYMGGEYSPCADAMRREVNVRFLDLRGASPGKEFAELAESRNFTFRYKD